MSEHEKVRDDTPATVEQIAAAMAALGMYHGSNTPQEHAQEAARLGGPDAYRVRLVITFEPAPPGQDTHPDRFAVAGL